MITTYIRSSSYGDFSFCEHKFFLRYVLGLPDVSNKKADKGNIVHKALELLGRRKEAEQVGITRIKDEAWEGEVDVAIIDPSFACSKAWEYCTKQFDHHAWEIKDYKDCIKMVDTVMEFNDGMFNPLKLDIVGVEKKFDIEIIKPWSSYNFNTPDGPLKGYLSLKGTVDLIHRVDKNILEIVDWKTGRRLDWNTGQEKTMQKLEVDAQLRMYHYAIHKLYPDIDQVMITIYYITDGGPYTVFFNRDDLPKTEELLQARFQQIKDTVRPRRIYPDWKCSKLCHYGKTEHPTSGKLLCVHYKDEIINLGIEKVTNKHADFKALTQYGAGGGKYEVKD